jgi:class 3 adenylate cyclase
LTELAAKFCGCPVALISLLDERRLWVKSKYGLPADFAECPREFAVCNTTICSNDLLYVPDLTEDARFKDLPIVIGEPYLRFYCGMPLIDRDGYALGTLCVVDFEAHEISPSQREAIRRLAQQAMAQLELHRQLLERDTLLSRLSEAKAAAEAARQRSDVLLQTVQAQSAKLAEWNAKLEERVNEQVRQLEGLSRLRRFFSPQLAEAILTGGAGDPLASHRREVVVVFLDLRGFTAFAETSETEEVMRVLREYHAEMGKLILEYDGTLERFTGDGIMIFFNDPVVISNPAERALRMAMAMRERVSEMSVGWRKHGYNLSLGIGIAQGYGLSARLVSRDGSTTARWVRSPILRHVSATRHRTDKS